jgi:hypothetical protein
MGETILVRPELTAAKIAGGEALLRRLDEEGMPIVAAFWLFREESAVWRLMLATPLMGKMDPRIPDFKVRAVLEKMGETRIEWLDTMLVAPDNWQVEQNGYQVWRGRLSKTAICHLDGGHRYIYRFLPRRLRG